jgi:hypothetical protein
MIQVGQIFLLTFTFNTISITDTIKWFNLMYYYHIKEELIKVDKKFIKKNLFLQQLVFKIKFKFLY